ncbi:zinc-binding alcohol dehydrogenase [Streptomyces sp. AJS327]|uniref:zinc-dependent alcohol dehydrogenase n=1 Tax=Streptomyces sp. AJS327 TaxID=2545265 RepID=UPI0015E0192A|nr:alcohol dehydrogenase catalytic domain-containing protein [Streptomyces sp. AJS327]MBA0052023.1 zinc-binding alcohol dehydrogenase [Streptomyces sp. AJS327]
MRAVVLKEFGRMALEEVATPEPGDGEARLRVRMTGVCGSDLHGFTGANGRRVPGQVMGHELVGVVEALGAGADLPLGALVTLNPVVGCGGCAPCRAGTEPYCPDKRVIGVDPTRTAGFAEYVVAPAANVVALPAGMPVAHGALVEPLAVGYHAARRGGVTAEDRVLVLGGGPIGQAVALAARRLSAARVVVSEPHAGRRDLCRALGVEVLDPVAGPVGPRVAARLDGPASVAIDAVGTSGTVADAFASTALGARIVLVGMAAPRLELDAFGVSTGERSLTGAFSYTSAEFVETARWAGTEPDAVAALVEREIPADRAPAQFAELAEGLAVAGKVLVRFS